jgi:glycosyltransferase involved in cell wall biosynthesis
MKKKIVFHSNYHKLFTGFGKNAKNILKYLYKTGKYDLIEVANGKALNDPELSKSPWKAIGSLPKPDKAIPPEERNVPEFQRRVGYGVYGIDEIIAEEKPDIYLGVEDVWAFDVSDKKKWWNKLSTIIWTTLDSLPILPTAHALAPSTNKFLTWSSFASREMMGYNNVGTLRGSVDCKDFYPLKKEIKSSIRAKNNIDKDDFLIGFVFRNQLRKSVPNLLDGFKKFIEKNPESKAKLLLHTHWSEGWDIPRLLQEKQIHPSLVLTTYFCSECKEYEIRPFSGQGQNCRLCGAQKSQSTTNIQNGVDESQLNEIYNILDVYCHPFTSGGMEIPIFEAKLCELITLVTNYSCGEDGCCPDSAGLPLDWSEYREPGTQFIKATTCSTSICDSLEKVYKMPAAQKRKLEKKAREYVLKNYSVEVIGKQLEAILDELPYCSWDFDMTEKPRNPSYTPSKQFSSHVEFLIDIYKNVLNLELNPNDSGIKYWVNEINNGKSPQEVLSIFKNIAHKENQALNKTNFEDLLDKDDKKRVALVVPENESDVLLSNSLAEGIKNKYPDHNLYFITNPNLFPLVDSNPSIKKCLPYLPQFEDVLSLEGVGEHNGYFDIVFSPFLLKKHHTFFHNGSTV